MTLRLFIGSDLWLDLRGTDTYLCRIKILPNYPYLFVYKGTAKDYELNYGMYGENTAVVLYRRRQLVWVDISNNSYPHGERFFNVKFEDNIFDYWFIP